MTTTFETLTQKNAQTKTAKIREFARQFSEQDPTPSDLTIVQESGWDSKEVDQAIARWRERFRHEATIAKENDLVQEKRRIQSEIQEAHQSLEAARAANSKVANPLIGRLEAVKAQLLSVDAAKRALVSTAAWPEDLAGMEAATRGLARANAALAQRRREAQMAAADYETAKAKFTKEREVFRGETAPRKPLLDQLASNVDKAKSRVGRAQQAVAEAEAAVSAADRNMQEAISAAREA